MSWTKLIFAIALLCVYAQAGELTYQGLWGNWTKDYNAPPQYYLCGAQVQFQ